MLWEQAARCCNGIGKGIVTLGSVNFESPNHAWGGWDCSSNLCTSFREQYLAQHTPVQQQPNPETIEQLSGASGTTREPCFSSQGTDIHTWNDQNNSSPLCWSQQGGQELSWPGIEITGKAKERKMINRCLLCYSTCTMAKGSVHCDLQDISFSNLQDISFHW